MDLRSLNQLVRQGEGERLEFKLKTNHPEKIVREIVAFTNTAGGRLLLGVDDHGVIKGLKYPDGDLFVLNKAINTLCFPQIPYTVERIPVGNEKEVLVYNIAHSPDKPHYILAEDGRKIVYVRIKDRSVKASREVFQIMQRSGEKRDVKFTYGEKEQKLMKMLDENPCVTVDSFSRQAGIPKKTASRTLVLLVLANVLEVHPDDLADQFTRVAI
jgi:predicted HTH transcriptional regulator